MMGCIMKLLQHIGIIVSLFACAALQVRGEEGGAGTLLTDTVVRAYTVEQVADLARDKDFGQSIKPQYGIQYHAITYLTPGLNGELSTASGMVVFPVELSAFPVLSYQHGDSTQFFDCPSNPDTAEIRYISCLYASTGYLVVAADYLGFGKSHGVHPFLHAATEASACRDMLRAARTLCEQMGDTWGPQLFLSGYSEGAHATLALQRLLEQDPRHEFTVTACAPQCGPYDLSGSELQFALRQKHSDALSLFTGLLLYSYNAVYRLYPDLTAIFTLEYARLMPCVFGGMFAGENALDVMPPEPLSLLDSDFVQTLSDPHSAMPRALRENDVYDWRPIAPVTFYYIGNDAVISPDNTHVAFKHMRKLGAKVKKSNLGGGYTHLSAFYPAQRETKEWFDKMR